MQLTKDKENADQHPDLYSSQALSLGRVGGHVVEDIDQHQEQGDQEGHPSYTVAQSRITFIHT